MTHATVRAAGRQKLARNVPIAMWIAALSVPFLGAAWPVCLWKDLPAAYVLGDPTALGGVPPYAGLLSSVGVLYWSAGAAVSTFGGMVLASRPRVPASCAFLLGAGLLTAWLALDDLFLLHESILPKLGVPEGAVLAAYGLLGAWFAVRFGARLLLVDGGLLAFSAGCLAGSVVLDVLFADGTVPEDVLKFVGIVGWSVYLVRLAWREVSGRPPAH